MAYCIVATYGNTTPVRWCSGVPKREDAEKLKEVAIGKGFRDATIWTEKEYRAICEARQREWADKKSAYRESR